MIYLTLAGYFQLKAVGLTWEFAVLCSSNPNVAIVMLTIRVVANFSVFGVGNLSSPVGLTEILQTFYYSKFGDVDFQETGALLTSREFTRAPKSTTTAKYSGTFCISQELAVFCRAPAILDQNLQLTFFTSYIWHIGELQIPSP